jgi:PAS domain S-box-containing protein
MASRQLRILDRTAVRYGFAILAVAAGLMIRIILGWAGAPGLPTYITFYPAVMTVALLLGFGPGLAATLATALVTAYWVLEPRGSLAVTGTTDLVGIALFIGMGIFMSVVAELYRRARQMAAPLEGRAGEQESPVQHSRPFGQSLLLYSGFAVSLAILTAIGWSIVRDLSAAADADRRAFHSHTVMDEWEGILSAFLDAESGQRGYLITDRDEYLESYNAALSSVKRRLESLKQLTRDSPLEEQRLVQVRSLSEEKLAEMKETIELRRTKGLQAAQDLVVTGRGKQIMDSLRALLARSEDEESRLLKQHYSAQEAASRKTKQAMLAGGGLSVLLLVSVFLYLNIENARRIRAEAELLCYQEHLQDMVTQRTAQWQEANAELKREIAEHEKAKERLRTERELLRVTITSIGDAVLATDITGKITFLNPVAENLTGCPEEQSLGQPVQSVFRTVNEQTHELGEDIVSLVLNQNRIVTLADNSVLVTREGHEVPIEDCAAPIRDTAGKQVGAVLVFHDVTERRRTLEELQRQAALIDLSPDGIMIRTLDGKIKLWGHGAELLYGWTKAEAVGQTADSLLKTQFPQPEEQIVGQLRANGRWTGELVHTAKDGHRIVVESRWLAHLDANGELNEMLESNLDITARKRAEALEQQVEIDLRLANEKLERKVQERTAELAKTVTNLKEEVLQRQQAEQQLAARAVQLRKLASEVTLAEQRERRRLAKVLHDHLQQLLVGAKFRTAILGRNEGTAVRQTAHEIEGLLDDAIGASRSLTAELSPPILYGAGLSAGLQWLARWMAERHGLQVELTIMDNTDPSSESVKVFLFESVRELLFNIVKHAQTDSARLDLRHGPDNMLQIVVADSGKGFGSEPEQNAGELAGGFGLSSMRERLKLIGGSMDIDSVPGQETSITLRVPLEQEYAHTEVSAAPDEDPSI